MTGSFLTRTNIVLSDEEFDLVLEHRRKKEAAHQRAEKQKNCKHKNTRHAGYGHNGEMRECVDCGKLMFE